MSECLGDLPQCDTCVCCCRLEKVAVASPNASIGGGGGVAAARASSSGAAWGQSRVGPAPPASRPRMGGWVAETMQRACPRMPHPTLPPRLWNGRLLMF